MRRKDSCWAGGQLRRQRNEVGGGWVALHAGGLSAFPQHACLSEATGGGNHGSNSSGQKRVETLVPEAARRKNSPHRHRNHLISTNIS